MTGRRHIESESDGFSNAAATDRRTDRRRSARGGVNGEASRGHLVALILGTYAEMPGLSLHAHQAARLFGLRETTCLVVLDDLVKQGRLRRAADGQYRV